MALIPQCGAMDAGISEVAQLRLVNSRSRCAGRVEVLHNQQWGTVCDDNWDLQDAGVVCRQLGCGTALSAPGGARFGRGSDRIWLDNVNCTGTEVALSDCRARPWGVNNCTHGEDAGVVCSGIGLGSFQHRPNVRLVGGPHRCAGRVEVRLDGRWGTVCDDGWGLNDVAVVCRQLDCGTAMEALSGKVFGPGNESDPVLMMDVQCQGTEAALGSCPYTDPGDICQHDEDAGARCQEPFALRLADGPGKCSGRLEVRYDGLWGTVCDDDWSVSNAQVVCRELGCGSTKPLAPKLQDRPRFGQGMGKIWLDDIHCKGAEETLQNCTHRFWSYHNCTHREDINAGVVCSELAQVRLANGSKHCAGRVEVLHNQQWGTVCDDGWDLQDAGVVCRQLGCGTALSAPGGARFGRGSDPQWLDEVNCAGTEAALSDCRARPWGERDCTHGEDAGVVCSGNLHPSCHSGWCIDRAGKLSAQTQLSCLSQR
uniref:SRCR domain-containing protein n=1 Tax=Chrysemys picta bellii TaxID=8478 RepID=A0A8C3FF85_CHRPI